ncbi:MAG: thioredoxin fold domain-containing protein [Desulfobacterales bacterium]|nr:MAG: thioredoxin fold domain-containing protein [Desulfobacterales bacterium]
MKLTAAGLIGLILCGLTGEVPLAKASSHQIEWHSYDSGLARGKFEKKNVFLNFYADWCAYCIEMDKKTFKDSSVVAYLNEHFISIKVDVDRETETANIFRVRGLPDSWFISKTGEIIGHRPGYLTPEMLLNILKAIMSESAAEKP